MIVNKKKLTVNSIVSKKVNKKPRREAFLSRDMAYLSVAPRIALGKMIGSGNYGTVYEVKGNNNLVVKVPNGFTPNTEGFNDTMSRARMLREYGSINPRR